MSLDVNKIKRFLSKSESKSLVYMISSCMVFLLAFFINVVMTNYCESESAFGQYKFSTTFVLTIPAILGFGINWSCASLIARNDVENKNSIITASVLTEALLGLIISIILFIGYLILPLFNITVLNDVIIVIPFVVVFMLQALINQIYSGLGEAFRLSLFNVIPNVFIIIGALLLVKVFNVINYSEAITLYIVGNILSVIPKLIKIKYSKSDIQKAFKILFEEIKSSGIKVYFSSLFTTFATQIIALSCGYIFGYVEYGFYSLAASLAQAFQIIGSTVAIVNFKKYTNCNRIDKKDFAFMVSFGFIAYIIMVLLIDTVFFWFYPESYAPSIKYLKFLCISNMLYGFSTIFNRFFIGKGKGGKVMKNSFIVAISNISISIPLIYYYKIEGLVISAVIVSIICNIAYFIDYKIDTKERPIDEVT